MDADMGGITTYAAIARRARVSRQHVRECALGNRKPGCALARLMIDAGILREGRHA